MTTRVGGFISEFRTVTSTADTTGCEGTTSAATVTLNAQHARPSDVRLTLVSPGGKEFVLREAGETSNLGETSYTADVAGEAKSGTWTLNVEDTKWWQTGFLASWDLSL